MTSKSTTASNKRKLVNVLLLDGTEYNAYVDVKSKFQEVFNQVAGYLCLRETEYFGLAFNKDNEYQFVVLDEKIHKLAPKQWKSGSGEGLDSQGKAIMHVCFRVQFYVDQVILLREKVTRHQYYLQLKENVLQYNHVYSEEKCFQQAAYALQADYGNYVSERHKNGYFNPSVYFPHWIIQRHGLDYLAHNVPTLHRDLHNMTKNDAELRYIRHSSLPPGALNLHFYMVRRRKTDKTSNTWLAVCARGVEVYEDDAGYKNHVSTFLWRDIGKLYFDKKKFEIRSVQSAGGRRFLYYTDSDIKSKYLLHICRSTHIFQMAIQPKLMEIQHLDNEDQKRYRESYISSDSRDRSQFEHSPSTSTNASVCNNTQRLSLVSNTSSNTTSGIVSDHRMAASFDDGDDHSREFMVDCPERLPRQIRSKLQVFSSFNQTPSYSQQASPNQSLEVCKAGSRSGSSQELSSCTSAHYSHTSGCLVAADLLLPSSATHTADSKPSLQPHRSGRFHGSLLKTLDRNTSADSAVSMSAVFSDLEKLSPASPLLLTTEQQMRCDAIRDGTASLMTPSGSFSLTPALCQLSSAPVMTIASPASEASSAAKLLTVHKTVHPLDEVVDQLPSSRADILQEHLQPVACCRSNSEHMKVIESSSPKSVGTLSKAVRTCPDGNHEHFELSVSAQDMLGIQQTKSASCYLMHAGENVQTGTESCSVKVSGKSNQSAIEGTLRKENQHIVQAQIHQSAEPLLAFNLQQITETGTDNYITSLQQGSVSMLEQTVLSRWAATELLADQTTTTDHIQEHYCQTSEGTRQQQLPSDYIHSQTQLLESSGEYLPETEDKESLCTEDRHEEKKVQTDTDISCGSHNKASLHPELKHILGQSHAFSLPLMTALCNDSSLMEASRSQSGSRSSYETSTVRSSDSRLTRLSHDTDSRRWSSCCQGANMPDVLLIQSSRPYSWHSEHFELDCQMAVPSSDHLPPSPGNPRSVNNKHINISNNYQQNIVPQKMIVSDPGPSSPRLITMAEGTYWWEAPPSAAETEATLSSWTGVIPYRLPAHHQPSTHSSQQFHHQQMVPHKLSSGGHRDSETSITHKQVMKENIGIA